jgi:F-type H+-transporting ATPase subunit b
MPQFDPTWFASQIFWLVVTFGALYWVLVRIALPRIGQVLEERADRIAGDLDRAKQVRDEAADVLAQYEKVLADARALAQSHLRAAQEEIAKQSLAGQARLAGELGQQAAAAEARIQRAKEAAIANVREIAVDVAQSAVGRLTGSGADGAEIARAVDSLLAERR